MMTKVNIDLWVLIAGVALPSACLLMVSLVYCLRRLTRRRRLTKSADAGFDQQVLLEMVLQQTDSALNAIVDAVQAQRVEMLKVLATHQLSLPTPAPMSVTSSLPEQKIEVEDPTPAEETSEKLKDSAEEMTTVKSSPAATVKKDAAILNTNTAALFDPYSQIPELIHQGLAVADVASRLNLPEAAVEMYVNLRMTDSKSSNQKSA